VTTDGTTKYMGAESVSCGYQHCCAIQKTDHSVVSCWGDNSGGELGNAGGGQYANTAVQGLGGKVAQIAAGYTNTCALLEDGTVQCWGGNAHGEVGNGNTNPISTPTTVTFAGLAAGVKARTVMTMGFFSCATMTDATAWCWGKGDEGELGDGMGLASFVPVQVKMPQ
jgi:alpha-tubulin suppressor-like RCC1 family protein